MLHLFARTGTFETAFMFGMLAKFEHVYTQPGSEGQPPMIVKLPPSWQEAST